MLRAYKDEHSRLVRRRVEDRLHRVGRGQTHEGDDGTEGWQVVFRTSTLFRLAVQASVKGGSSPEYDKQIACIDARSYWSVLIHTQAVVACREI